MYIQYCTNHSLTSRYGQTASGKTHTMIGNDEEPGIIPLAISELFEYISEVRVSSL